MTFRSSGRLFLLFGVVVSSSCFRNELRRSSANDVQCGIASLYALQRTNGASGVSFDEVRNAFGEHGPSVSFAQIEEAAGSLGMRLVPYQMNIDALRTMRPRGVLHMNNDHFVAITGYEPNGVVVVDLTTPSEWNPETWSFDRIALRWSGHILVEEGRGATGR